MIITELIKAIEAKFPSKDEQSKMIENLIRKKNELHICDLDFVLILLGFSDYFNVRHPIEYLKGHNELLLSIVDSSLAKYFAPNFFKTDAVPVDDNERCKVLVNEINETINEQLNDEVKVEIYNHELLKEVDIDYLVEKKVEAFQNSSKFKIEVNSDKVFSFGLSQTNFKILKDIIITNNGDKEIKDARLVLSSDPSYVEFNEIKIPLLNPNQPISINEFEMNPHIEQLMDLKEKVVGVLNIKLFLGDVELASITSEISYYSFDTTFESVIPGSNALFVTPNDVAVDNTVGLVAKELEFLTGDSSLCDYQRNDKNHVFNQLKALYNTIHNQAIAYITTSPSFENVGQKIRLPHDVLVHKQGNCLELAVLFASCAENMGLNPFLVIVEGHAFFGAFLEQNNFPSMIYTDAAHTLEMNSEEENEIIFVECTACTAGNSFSFEEAVEEGRKRVVKSLADPFFEIIDINRARSNGFLPLPINFNDVDRAIIDFKIVEQNKERLAHKSYNYKGDKLELSEAEINKFDVWEKKLLDLTKRNQLINYKLKGKGLQLKFYDLNKLYHSFDIKRGNYHVLLNEKLEVETFELPAATRELYEQIDNDFENKNISLYIRSDAQKASLKFFEKERKKSFEETGSNVFYLALGFVQYFENSASLYPLYAPLILVPIDLIKHSKDDYSISGREEPPFLNLSILEFFNKEFGVNCDNLVSSIDFEDENLDVNSVLNTIGSLLGKVKGTSIVRTAVINVFNFSKAVMWADVKYRKEELSQHKVIKSIIDGKYFFEDNEKIGEGFDDNNCNPEDLICDT